MFLLYFSIRLFVRPVCLLSKTIGVQFIVKHFIIEGWSERETGIYFDGKTHCSLLIGARNVWNWNVFISKKEEESLHSMSFITERVKYQMSCNVSSSLFHYNFVVPSFSENLIYLINYNFLISINWSSADQRIETIEYWNVRPSSFGFARERH